VTGEERAGQAFSPYKRNASIEENDNVVPLFGRKAVESSLAKAA
jgi:hypothetical protein